MTTDNKKMTNQTPYPPILLDYPDAVVIKNRVHERHSLAWCKHVSEAMKKIYQAAEPESEVSKKTFEGIQYIARLWNDTYRRKIKAELVSKFQRPIGWWAGWLRIRLLIGMSGVPNQKAIAGMLDLALKYRITYYGYRIEEDSQ